MIYILFGITDRDRDEKVCQMFADMQTLDEFVTDLPGSYNVLHVEGADYEALNVVDVVSLNEDEEAECERQHIGHTVTYITTEKNSYRAFRNDLNDPWTIGKNLWTDTENETLYCEECDVEIPFDAYNLSFD